MFCGVACNLNAPSSLWARDHDGLAGQVVDVLVSHCLEAGIDLHQHIMPLITATGLEHAHLVRRLLPQYDGADLQTALLMACTKGNVQASRAEI